MIIDPRDRVLAKNLLSHSVKLKKSETVYLDLIGLDAVGLLYALIDETTKIGAIPYWNMPLDELTKPFFKQASDEQHQLFANFHKEIMEKVDAYIGIRGSANPFEHSDLTPDEAQKKKKYFWNEVHSKTRLKKRWVVLRYPNNAMSVMASMSTEKFAEHYYQVCNYDYSLMEKNAAHLKKLMEKTDKVRITAPGTDLTFSIKNIPACICAGELNIPDGEVFTSPVKTSINGKIQYNTPTIYDGVYFKNIWLKIKDGRIEDFGAEIGPQKHLEKIFNTDDGSRFFGEFAIGIHPLIKEPICDILFDEKIAGSIHLTPGSSYDMTDNGNRSAQHWDLVLIQRPEYGGGEIYFDDKLVRKDGLFVLDELKALN